MVGTPGHDRAQEYLTQQMQRLGLLPYWGQSFHKSYTLGGKTFTNLAGQVPGGDRSLPPVAIVAHYDSVIQAPCADDNAAAVAIALEAARLLARRELPRDVLILLPDAEEPPYYQSGCMGSIRFYEDQIDIRGIHAAIVMDLVGHEIEIPAKYLGNLPFLKGGVALPLKDLVFMTGVESHPQLQEAVAASPSYQRMPLICTLNSYVGDISDHGIFRRNGIPYLFLSCGRWAHYHQPTDTPDRLAYGKMATIAELIVDLVLGLSATELPSGCPEPDTTNFEITSMEKALGPLLTVGLKLLGIPKLISRTDLDRVAAALLSAGL